MDIQNILIGPDDFIHVRSGDEHVGHPVMDAYEYYRTVHTPRLSLLKRLPRIDLITVDGDLFHAPVDSESEIAQVVEMMILDFKELAMSKNAKLRIIRGTNGHDGRCLNYFMRHTKYGKLFENPTDILEKNIINTIKRSKEHAISVYEKNEDSTDLMKNLQELYDIHMKSLNASSSNVDFRIYDQPTRENIGGFDILFVPEVYDKDDENINRIFSEGADICIYHGMIEGVIPIAKQSSMTLIYNKSIILKDNIFEHIKYYTVCSHIHKRMGIVPKIPHKEMFEIMKNIKVWYGGSTLQHNFGEAGNRTGSEVIVLNRKSKEWTTYFLEVKNGPKFKIYEATKLFKSKDIQQLIAMFIKIKQQYEDVYLRLDVDLSLLTDKEKLKFKEFRVNFKDFTYKTISSKDEVEYEKQVLENKKKLEAPLKQLVLSLTGDNITEEDYDELFPDD